MKATSCPPSILKILTQKYSHKKDEHNIGISEEDNYIGVAADNDIGEVDNDEHHDIEIKEEEHDIGVREGGIGEEGIEEDIIGEERIEDDTSNSHNELINPVTV